MRLPGAPAAVGRWGTDHRAAAYLARSLREGIRLALIAIG
jgi:hypothetical protein